MRDLEAASCEAGRALGGGRDLVRRVSFFIKQSPCGAAPLHAAVPRDHLRQLVGAHAAGGSGSATPTTLTLSFPPRWLEKFSLVLPSSHPKRDMPIMYVPELFSDAVCCMLPPTFCVFPTR